MRRTVEEEGICIDFGDLILEWHPPKFVCRKAPAFEDGGLVNGDPGGAAIIDVELRSFTDGDLSGIGKLAATEEILVGKGRDDVYCEFDCAVYLALLLVVLGDKVFFV